MRDHQHYRIGLAAGGGAFAAGGAGEGVAELVAERRRGPGLERAEPLWLLGVRGRGEQERRREKRKEKHGR